MCNTKPLTPEALKGEMENPNFCASGEMIYEENHVIDHYCKTRRGD